MTVYVSVKINHAMGNLKKGDIVQGVLKKHGVVINDGVVPNRLVDERHIDDVTITSGKSGLRPLRIAKRVSARELGDFIGKSPSAIYSYENGLHGVPDRQRTLICEYLNTDPRHIDFDAVKKAHDLKAEVDQLTQDERNELVRSIDSGFDNVTEMMGVMSAARDRHAKYMKELRVMTQYIDGRTSDDIVMVLHAFAQLRDWNNRSLWQKLKDFIACRKLVFDITNAYDSELANQRYDNLKNMEGDL